MQPFLGAPLQFTPALGSVELEQLIDAHVWGTASFPEKMQQVTLDFFNTAVVDLNNGSLVKEYQVFPSMWENLFDYELSLIDSQSLDFASTAYSSSSASPIAMADSGYGSMGDSDFSFSEYNSTGMTPPNRTQGGRVTKKAKKAPKDTKKVAETRLPGFSIMTKDGIDVTSTAGRGTKTKEQREHAHLMRIMKACEACKRKKIRCDPSHRRPANEVSTNATTSTTTTTTTRSASFSSCGPDLSPTYYNPPLNAVGTSYADFSLGLQRSLSSTYSTSSSEGVANSPVSFSQGLQHTSSSAHSPSSDSLGGSPASFSRGLQRTPSSTHSPSSSDGIGNSPAGYSPRLKRASNSTYSAPSFEGASSSPASCLQGVDRTSSSKLPRPSVEGVNSSPTSHLQCLKTASSTHATPSLEGVGSSPASYLEGLSRTSSSKDSRSSIEGVHNRPTRYLKTRTDKSGHDEQSIASSDVPGNSLVSQGFKKTLNSKLPTQSLEGLSNSLAGLVRRKSPRSPTHTTPSINSAAAAAGNFSEGVKRTDNSGLIRTSFNASGSSLDDRNTIRAVQTVQLIRHALSHATRQTIAVTVDITVKDDVNIRRMDVAGIPADIDIEQTMKVDFG
ncbi:hypothetical protein G7Y89_g13000 [Cudoniella acicularis]|uniref:Uncharacterized protein n=1 Tax=Cudoniella acicularis TaxID=354080 RepID=A0A8H4VYN2_9HELO|nr:hypothetical protein G7Y89_g13000 [Cudoniella acicularis]